MTFPINFHIGGIIIPSHFIFDVLACWAAIQYYFYLSLKKPDPLSNNNRWSVIIGGALGALVGSRLLASLERPYLFSHPPSLLFYYENATIVGALVGAIIGVELVKLLFKIKTRSGDIFTYPLILGIMIGRIGCFLTGVKDDTVGLPSNLPWAIDQGDGIRRHPTSLYEILFLGILWIILYRINKRYALRSGVLFRLFIIGYLTFRFFVEFIKPIQPIAFGLSSIQIVCLCFAVFYTVTLLVEYWRDRSLKIRLQYPHATQ